jgi:hypothetical protein
VSGEALHEAGRDGAVRAKRWLERTTRVAVHWVNPDAVQKLTFEWSDGSAFSFDLGGTLHGGDMEGEEFFAEVKKYSVVGEQPAHYGEYLAKCYRAYSVLPQRCDHFFWITWHPFSQKKWNALCSGEEVRKAVFNHSAKCLGEATMSAAEPIVDAATCATVAERLWLIVLSDKQEDLVIEDDHLDAVFARQRGLTR